jgi:periplasmic protein TonB
MAGRGAPATEAPRRGPAADPIDAAGYSNAARPSALELSRPRAGGADDGVRGPGGAGLVARSSSPAGSGASRRAVPRGESASIRAERSDPYFRRMYQRIDREVRYPRDLALALEQGEVTVELTLDEAGRIAALAVTRPSGFAAFDREIVRAMRAAGPFGPPPVALRGRASSLRVEAPYMFSNPLVR